MIHEEVTSRVKGFGLRVFFVGPRRLHAEVQPGAMLLYQFWANGCFSFHSFVTISDELIIIEMKSQSVVRTDTE